MQAENVILFGAIGIFAVSAVVIVLKSMLDEAEAKRPRPEPPPVSHLSPTPDTVAIDAFDVLIDYRDAGGHVTAHRQVTVHAIEIDDVNADTPRAHRFEGYCHLRKRARSFRTDRIIRFADASTGQLARDPSGWLGARAIANRLGKQ